MKIFFYLAAILISGNVSAQVCNYIIPPHSEQNGVGNIHIFSDTTISNPDGSNFYICTGVSVIMNASGGSNYYLEDGASLTINQHDGDNVIAKGNCTIVDNTTESIVVTKEASSTFSKPNMSSAAVILTCANMVYDYSSVGGSSPCAILGIEPGPSIESFLISPNPVNASGELNFGTEIQDLQLFDITGRRVANYESLNQSSVILDLESGVFFVLAKSTSGLIYSSRLIAK